MKKAPVLNQYSLLARHYDRFFTFHLDWYRRARRSVLGKMLPHIGSACDLACGTGTTALELASRGIKVFAVDLSPTMCRITRQKAARARAKISVLRADMRTFRLPEPVDLITCEFDAVNHVPKKSDLSRVASAASRAMRPGGYFYFDVNNRMAFQKIWPGTWQTEKPGLKLIMGGGYDRARDRGWTNVKWLVRTGSSWRRVHERVEQVSWTAKEIRKALRDAGFNKIRTWDATPFFRGDLRIRPGCRTFYLAQKI
ncbi:MAG: class I SAM-dependent DNA methyltransferase [Terriglobia bacterium]